MKTERYSTIVSEIFVTVFVNGFHKIKKPAIADGNLHVELEKKCLMAFAIDMGMDVFSKSKEESNLMRSIFYDKLVVTMPDFYTYLKDSNRFSFYTEIVKGSSEPPVHIGKAFAMFCEMKDNPEMTMYGGQLFAECLVLIKSVIEEMDEKSHSYGQPLNNGSNIDHHVKTNKGKLKSKFLFTFAGYVLILCMIAFGPLKDWHPSFAPLGLARTLGLYITKQSQEMAYSDGSSLLEKLMGSDGGFYHPMIETFNTTLFLTYIFIGAIVCYGLYSWRVSKNEYN